MTLRNQRESPEDLYIIFFVGGSLYFDRKNRKISVKTFFFGDHIIILTKLRHISRLFWTSQNRKFVIFELDPGPRSALGAPDYTLKKILRKLK